jgi:hypothetical protein
VNTFVARRGTRAVWEHDDVEQKLPIRNVAHHDPYLPHQMAAVLRCCVAVGCVRDNS